MFKLLKLLKTLKAQGFASATEKAEVKTLVKEAGAEAEVVADEVAEVEALPEEDASAKDEVVAEVKKAISSSAVIIEKNLSTKIDSQLSAMKSEIEAWAKAQKDAIEKGIGAGHDQVALKHKKFNSYLKKFANAVMSGDDASAKEMTTDKAGSPFAGYAVDSELSAEIRHLTTMYGVARREMFSTPLSKNSYEANALATDVTVAWVAEAGVIGSTQIVLSQEELKLKKLAAIVSLTRELIEDQEVDLFAFIATRVAEGFAKAEDRAFFMGTGSGDTTNGEFTGIIKNASVPVVNLTGALSTLSVEKIYDMIDTLPEGAQANAKFYGHRSIKSKLRLLKDGNGQYIYLDPINNSDLPTLAGKPFVTVEVMTKASDVASTDSPFLLLADLKKTSILGYQGGIVADRFNAGVIKNVAGNADINLITTDREAIRWVQRVGAMTILPTAGVILATVEAGS